MFHERWLRRLILSLLLLTIGMGAWKVWGESVKTPSLSHISSFFSREDQSTLALSTVEGKVLSPGPQIIEQPLLVAINSSDQIMIQWEGKPLSSHRLGGFAVPEDVKSAAAPEESLQAWLFHLPVDASVGKLCLGSDPDLSPPSVCYHLVLHPKAAAPESSEPSSEALSPSSLLSAENSGLQALILSWEGSEKTRVDERARFAEDLSALGHEFETLLKVESSLHAPVKIQVEIREENVTFTHQIAAGTSDRILVRVSHLDYGEHRLRVTAQFADGRETAEAVIPFVYRRK